VEILVVIVVLGILATVVLFTVRGVTDRGEQSACAGDARTLTTAADTWMAQESRNEVPALGTSADRYELFLVDKGMIRQVSTYWNLQANGTVTTTGNPCQATAAAPTAIAPTAIAPTAIAPTAIAPTANEPTAIAPTAIAPTANEPTANEPKLETVIPGFPATDDLQVFLLQTERDPDLLGKSGAELADQLRGVVEQRGSKQRKAALELREHLVKWVDADQIPAALAVALDELLAPLAKKG